MGFKGLLDYLDQVDQLLGEIKLIETIDPSVVRKNQRKVQNARMIIQEARRIVERAGQETPT